MEIHFLVGWDRQCFLVVCCVGSAVTVPGFESWLFLPSDLEKVNELLCASDFLSVKMLVIVVCAFPGLLCLESIYEFTEGLFDPL